MAKPHGNCHRKLPRKIDGVVHYAFGPFFRPLEARSAVPGVRSFPCAQAPLRRLRRYLPHVGGWTADLGTHVTIIPAPHATRRRTWCSVDSVRPDYTCATPKSKHRKAVAHVGRNRGLTNCFLRSRALRERASGSRAAVSVGKAGEHVAMCKVVVAALLNRKRYPAAEGRATRG